MTQLLKTVRRRVIRDKGKRSKANEYQNGRDTKKRTPFFLSDHIIEFDFLLNRRIFSGTEFDFADVATKWDDFWLRYLILLIVLLGINFVIKRKRSLAWNLVLIGLFIIWLGQFLVIFILKLQLGFEGSIFHKLLFLTRILDILVLLLMFSIGKRAVRMLLDFDQEGNK
jgi:hypothetical protein